MSISDSIEKDLLDVPYEEMHKKWQTKFERGQLTTQDLRNFWKYYVPEIFSPEPECDCLKITYDEEMAQMVLFGTLERFMYGGDPTQIFKMIKELDTPPALCGRVFKTGDPTYGCRDCGMDPTCVLCAECFQNSAHNKHRYKISTSSGGGYCDCGDGEAWKSDVFCNIHIKGKNAQPLSANIFEKLPVDLVDRIHFVFDTVLQYAKHLLTHTNNFSLPSDLEIRDWEGEPYGKAKPLFEVKDAYVTMLYNDETHTYDQVIDALMRAIDCSRRDSFTYATSIDREGRCIVRCSTFKQCSRAKTLMDRPVSRNLNRPLRVEVVHTFIISHQVFASRLLSWVHNILKSGQAFRQIFNDIVTKDNCTLIQSIFEADTQMWKTARIQWHRLFISGMLMEIESKKIFSRVFTKHYSQMMKDFIQDDHEHSVCVVSLGVQLFTMPTIAHMLIAEEDVLAKLLCAFLSECRRNLKNGKLSLESKRRDINTFKRIQYILYDFKYLLGFKPDAWTTELRRGFLHGFEKLLTLLSMMQGMDPMVRQVWQHMEFEPEWESAFNLHLKLASILPLVIEWAASDQVVLIKAYRMLLKALGEQTTDSMRHKYVRELLNYSVSCSEYDVASAPVSLHLPLSRLIAGMTLKLEKYGLSYNSVDFNVKGKSSPEQLMEPVLRTQVMIAQANAGMWRRNGFSLTNQIYFYHNVRCRQEMLDRDIMLLQETATLMDANEFLIHLLNRFNLINWSRSDFETAFIKGSDEDRQTVDLAEEFLTLVLHLVSERYTVGIGCVTEEDCIKKEIIQLLCIEPMPHSVLNKALPEGVNHETGMEKVIDEVAIFKKPSADGKGYFELKEEFFVVYNFFFYHYSREEQSKSEVAQRNRKKNAGEPLCCPPPIPPKFTENFTLLVNVMQCDIFLYILGIVLQRFGDEKSVSVTESHLHIALHLIGYALHEEERYIKAQDPYFRFTTKAQNCFILPLLEFLNGSQRAAMHKDILRWTINRFHEVSRLSASDPVKPRQSTPEVTGSPGGSGSSVCAEKKRKADIAAERKARIMSKMSNMQKKFILKNESLFKETPASEAVPADMPSSSLMDTSTLLPENMIAVGPHQTLPPYKESIYTCILCHQDDSALPSSSNESGNTRAMVLGALVQRSTVLSRDRLNIAHILSPETHDTLLLPIDLHWGAHISSCGHAMHAKCWQRYFDDVMCRERRKPHRTRQVMSFDIEKYEYLCPLCESLCNTALPLLPTVTSTIRKDDTSIPQEVHLCPDFWLRALEHVIKERIPLKESRESSPPSNDEGGTEKDFSEDEESKVSESPESKALSTLLKMNEDPSPRKVDPKALLSYLKTRKKLKPRLNARYKLLSLEAVLKDLQNSVSPPVDAEGDEFRRLFVCSQGRSYPEFSSLAIEMISGFSLSIYTRGLHVHPDGEDPRVPQMIWASTAYTIKTLEETQRNSKRALLASLSTRLLDSLVALVNFAAYIPVCLGSYEHMNTTCIRLLCCLIDSSQEEQARCLLEWDAFSMLTSLSMSMYSLFSKAEFTSTGSIQDLYLLRVTFFVQVVQILLCLDENALEAEIGMECEDPPASEEFSSIFNFAPSEGDASDGAFLLSILNGARHHLKLPPVLVAPLKLLECVKQQCLPFLRCCGIFFHLLTEVPVPEELKSTVWVPESEFFCLLRYLGLESHFTSNFSIRYFDDLLKTWCSHPRILQVFEERKSQNAINLWLHINRLIPLPKDYSVLMNTVSQFPCHASIGDDSRTPTMCLTCGKMLCSQSYCCQMELPEDSEPMVGACTYHANFCGASVGVFLKVRECRILLLSGRIKGCFVTPPYLDEYGEADHGLKRGNPLRLDDSSYSRLHNMWLSHSVPDVIAHTMEGTSNVLITEWYHY